MLGAYAIFLNRDRKAGETLRTKDEDLVQEGRSAVREENPFAFLSNTPLPAADNPPQDKRQRLAACLEGMDLQEVKKQSAGAGYMGMWLRAFVACAEVMVAVQPRQRCYQELEGKLTKLREARAQEVVPTEEGLVASEDTTSAAPTTGDDTYPSTRTVSKTALLILSPPQFCTDMHVWTRPRRRRGQYRPYNAPPCLA